MNGRLRARAMVVGRALASVLIGSRRNPPQTPRRILIAHHLLLGDTLMLTPLLAKLRARYPLADVAMTVPRAVAPLYAARPYGVDVLPWNPRDADSVSRLLETPGYDLAVVPGDNRHCWLARAMGARWIVAFAGDRPAWKNRMADHLVDYPERPAAWGDMTAGLIDGPAPDPYDPADWPSPACAPFDRPAAPYCILHVGASTSLKQWEPEKWQALAQHLGRQGLQVVWSAGAQERSLVEAADPAHRFPSYAGKLDLAQLWHLVRDAALLVSPDTGIAHLGRLTHTPTVVLFGPGSPVLVGAGEFWRRSPYRALTVEAYPCRDQRILFRREIPWVRRCGRSTDECARPGCMQALSAQAIIDTIRTLLPSAS